MRALLTGLLALVLTLTGCVSEGKFLEDYAACPATERAECTADVQDRVQALEALRGVTEVVSVDRGENLDTPLSIHAEVVAEVADEQEALELAAQGLAVLDDWPQYDTGSMTLLLTADPPVTIDYVGRQSLDLPQGAFDPCPEPDCADVLDEVQAGVEEEYDGVGPLTFERRGDTLVVRGTVDGDQAELVSRAVEGNLVESGYRVAPQVDIVIRGRAPLSLEYHVEGDVVCGVPPQTDEGCEGRETVPFG